MLRADPQSRYIRRMTIGDKFAVWEGGKRKEAGYLSNEI